MDAQSTILIFALFIGLAIVFRLIAGSMDRPRISDYIASRGGREQSISWAPFGPGWFGEKSDRIYQVRYVDNLGQLHDAHCKTSLTTGVYFTEDRVVSEPPFAKAPPEHFVDDRADLVRENRRLREELARLKKDSRDA